MRTIMKRLSAIIILALLCIGLLVGGSGVYSWVPSGEEDCELRACTFNSTALEGLVTMYGCEMLGGWVSERTHVLPDRDHGPRRA